MLDTGNVYLQWKLIVICGFYMDWFFEKDREFSLPGDDNK